MGVVPRRPHRQNSCNSLQILSEARQTAFRELSVVVASLFFSASNPTTWPEKPRFQ